MYKFFSELENSENFITYLSRKSFDIKKYYAIEKPQIVINSFNVYDNLFQRINFLDMIVEGSVEGIIEAFPSSYEDWQSIGSFLMHKQDNYSYTKQLKEMIDINHNDLYELLDNYLVYCKYLVTIYPNLQDFLLTTGNMIEKILIELRKTQEIELPALSNGVASKWPNAFYITPHGYLYNTGGKEGHKEGNLIYPFYRKIYNILLENGNIANINNYNHIAEILERGYVTSYEFLNYSNLIYDIPTIFTPEVEHDIERHRTILNMSEEDFEKLDKRYFPHPRRSYQKNIITLVTGHLAAESSLFQSFRRLNVSKRKREIIEQLYCISKGDLSDILVRFCKFSKVESIVDKTITTSLLTGIENFRAYLDKGWDLHLIPGVVYDQTTDELSEVNFNSIYIDNYLDKELNKYEGKGKVIIKR